MAWFEQCLAPYGTNLYPKDIYFVVSRGVRTEITGTITVIVAIKELMAEGKIVYSNPEHPRSRNQKI